MAFWLKWEKGLARKQEILQIAARLLIPPTQAAGTLMQVMEWLDDNVTDVSEDGHARVTLKSLSVSFIDHVVGVTGFGEAMAEVGWLRVEDGILVFVNAGRHNGKSAKNRMLAADRKAKQRSRNSHARKGTKTATLSSLLYKEKEGVQGEAGSPDKPAAKPDSDVGTGVTIIPLLLSSEAFKSAWKDWLQHRAEKKKPIVPGSMAEKEALKKLEEWGEARAIAAIRHSIANNWQGIFEPDDKQQNAKHRTSSQRGFEGQQDYSGVGDKT